jgi:hypothetical protein
LTGFRVFLATFVETFAGKKCRWFALARLSVHADIGA